MFIPPEFDFENQINHIILNPKQEDHWILLNKIKSLPKINTFDKIEIQVGELFKLRAPTKKYNQSHLNELVEEFFRSENRDLYGNWVYYPWSHSLVHLLAEEEFAFVRTGRNRYKITEEEQLIMSSKKIGVVGLSVGQSVALCLAMERTFQELRIADFDTLELSNMNRIRTKVSNLGLEKTRIVVQEIAEIDPYLNVKVFNDGLTEDNIDAFFSDGGDLDLLIEECDSLDMKILSRIKAKSLKIPVLMDTSDRGMIDVERFDLEPDRLIFHGMLSKFGDEKELLNTMEENRGQIMMSILDFDKLSQRAKISINEIGKSISTWPQLASSVVMGGAMCAYFAKVLLCGQSKYSGRFYVDLDEFIIIEDESKN